MADGAEADPSPPTSSVATTQAPSMQTSASESTDGAASPHTSIISTIALPAEIQADEDEEEVTTAEFSVDLTDGQTWAINFYECAAEGDIECLEEILDSGRVGVNDVDVDGFTALMVAAAEGHHNVVRALLRRGADVSVQTFELRSTALHFAAKNGDKETVEALCESDAAVVDCWNVNTDTPLIWACIEGRAEAVQVLLKYGADVNMLNQYGASTVMCAAMIGEDPEQDAETDQPRAEIMKMLLEKSRKLVNFQDREGSTAMHLAASCGYLECVKTLLAFGADITLRNIIGQTPLEEAQGSGIRESGPCVDHLRGMWRQLEEEAAARMMAMLEMEEEAGKSSTNTSGGSKKSKKRNKKAKRKAAAAKQQQEQEQDQQESHQQEDRSADRGDQEVEMATDPPFAQSSHDSTHGSISASQKNSNEECPTSSDEDTPTRDSRVSTGPDLSDDEDDRDVDDGKTDTNHVAGGDKEKSTLDDFTTPVAGAWTTVGKKHRSFLATTSSESTRATAVSGSGSSPKEKSQQSTPTRRKSTTVSPPKTTPQASRRRVNSRTTNDKAQGSIGAHVAQKLISKRGGTAGRTPTAVQDKRQEEALAPSRPTRPASSTSPLNPNAVAFRTPVVSSGSTNTSGLQTSLGANGFPFSSTLPWRPSFSSPFSMAPYTTTATSSLSSVGQHYTSVGRLAWKQHQRMNGNFKVAREARERWVSKLRLSNENVAETLGYLACGLCGELVNDNLQCSGGATAGAHSDQQKTVACTQLYCASCLHSPAFQTADSTVFKCVRCNQVVTKASMTRNSFAQAQAAALGLSMSNSTPAGCANGTQDDSPEEMQRILEASEPRAAAVDIRAFHMIPGTKLSALSNGQLEVLENAHQVALTQIMEQRLANARALERLQMEEWLKMQHDVLQFTPR